jgi:hypothetical protein
VDITRSCESNDDWMIICNNINQQHDVMIYDEQVFVIICVDVLRLWNLYYALIMMMMMMYDILCMYCVNVKCGL